MYLDGIGARMKKTYSQERDAFHDPSICVSYPFNPLDWISCKQTEGLVPCEQKITQQYSVYASLEQTSLYCLRYVTFLVSVVPLSD